MPHKTGISNILLGAILIALTSAAYADDAADLHPTPGRFGTGAIISRVAAI